MKKVVAINTSPRGDWNTAQLVKEACKGCETQGAEVVYYDLYRLNQFTGCISCFGCKLDPHKGVCIYNDGLAPVLKNIREAGALIIGTPNYLGNPSSGFMALYERLIFQSLTYNKENMNCNTKPIPVLFIMTSNAPKASYDSGSYKDMVEKYVRNLDYYVGPTKVLIAGNTLQVFDYSRYDWTLFNPEEKLRYHQEHFPLEKKKAYQLGKELYM